MTQVIFHSPMRVAADGAVGSAIRPYRMLEAFRQEGYDVIDVTGTAVERREKAIAARRALRAGDVAFCYSELSSSPIAMSEPRSSHVDPRDDFQLFADCRSAGVPVGAFYRDVYWRFPGFLEWRRLPYRLAMRYHYERDLRRLAQTVDVLFLPSMRMGDYIPVVDPKKFRELPPGAPIAPLGPPEEGVRLFYVGGLGRFYDLAECVAAVAQTEEAELTMCVPPAQWEAHREDYERFLCDRIRVVHGRGAELEPYFVQANIGVLAMKPIEYRSFAAPIKLFEYLGRGLPVLASKGTYAGDFIEKTGAGWAPEYSRKGIGNVLARVIADPSGIADARTSALRVREETTWAARARQAALALLE
ncbi:glycosyltransferase involved in cell wall biosynthesis [Schaalia hyovaginalis]|uniref:Glycosyltransferase involved in cell wall biosynthesis n=1 Tax=Schaalia hyovaginalis TaxID=29316 RepID=A0A923E620_9ACTO|nr:glycosyl transferase family 1 [Schaalia hyovaginalis]MBB6334261.1 glycosyltransferase involved in cell wall biosynthesis [Schaalia hyovaginalis]